MSFETQGEVVSGETVSTAEIVASVDRIAAFIDAECGRLPACDVVEELEALSSLLPRAARLRLVGGRPRWRVV